MYGRENEINSKTDIVTELDAAAHKQEWCHSIIGAMEKIQKQFAIEQNLDVKLHKDYLSDRDKLKFFWSGFTNSSAPKTFFDIFFKSIFNWEIILFLFLIVFLKIYIYDNPSIHYANLIIFTCSYISIISYSLYFCIKWRYYVYGDLSSKMMIYLLIGRLSFLIIVSIALSCGIIYGINYLYSYPKTAYEISNGVYWILDELSLLNHFTNKIDFFNFIMTKILPTLRYTAYEMLFIFLIFGILPFFIIIIARVVISKKRIKDEQRYKNN